MVAEIRPRGFRRSYARSSRPASAQYPVLLRARVRIKRGDSVRVGGANLLNYILAFIMRELVTCFAKVLVEEDIMAVWRRSGWARLIILAAMLILTLCSCQQAPATSTDLPSNSVTVTVQATHTATPAPTRTPTPRPAPTATATRVPPPPPTATPQPPAPQGCYPLTNGGNCYEPGEYCRTSDHGATGIAGDGERIVCTDNDGWRWEPY